MLTSHSYESYAVRSMNSLSYWNARRESQWNLFHFMNDWTLSRELDLPLIVDKFCNDRDYFSAPSRKELKLEQRFVFAKRAGPFHIIRSNFAAVNKRFYRTRLVSRNVRIGIAFHVVEAAAPISL